MAPQGRQFDYVYDGKHRVIKAVLSKTKNREIEGWLKIEYGENQCQVSSNGGDSVIYQLTADGCLDSVEKSDGTWCRYTYLEHPLERSFLISEKNESSGICLKLFYYDDEKTRQNFKTGKIKDLYRSLDGGESYTLLYHFDYEPGVTSVVNSQGVLSCYYYNQSSQIQQIKTFLEASLYRTEEMEWKNGRMVRKTEKDGAGHLLRQQRWRYDLHNNLIEEILEGTLTQEGKQLESHHRKASYDLHHRLIEESEEEGIKATYEYEGNLLTTKLVWNGDEVVERTRYYYDSEERLIHTLIDDQASVYTFEKIDGFNILDQPLIVTKGIIDCVTGEEVIEEQVTFTYDEKGRIIRESHPDRAIIYEKNEKRILEGDKETVFHFSNSGKLLQEEVYKNKKRLSSFQYHYNSLGQLVEKVENGNVTSYEYDCLGRKIKETLPAVLSPQDISISYVNSFAFDPLDRIINTNGKQTSYNVRGQPLEGKLYTLSGRLEKETYEDGSYCCFTYDHLGRVIKKRVYNSLDEEIKSQENLYFGSQLQKEIFSSGITIEHSYNSRGEKQSSCCLETGRKISYGNEKFSSEEGEEAIEWTQNDRGQTVLEKRHVNPDGSFITTLYDALQRPEKIESYLSTGALFLQKNLRYDEKGRKIQERIGDLTNSWEYDEKGNLLTQIEAKGSLEEKKTSFTYTSSGKLETEIKPNGVLICYEYNPSGELSRIKSENLDYELFYNKNGEVIEIIDHIHELTTKRTYNLEGQITSETLGNGLTIENQYDLSGKRIGMTLPDSGSVEWKFEEDLTTITRYSPSKIPLYQYTKTPTSAELIHDLGTISYERNQEGRIQKISSLYFEQEANYDAFGRLTALKTCDPQGSYTNSYTYLPNGFEENNTSYCSDSFENILRDEESSLSYDLAGNLIKKISGEDTFHFSYDPLNRLIEVKKNGEVLHSYVYDIYHRRIYDLKNGIRYIYDGNEETGVVDAQGKIRELRILPSVAFELDEEIYAPIYDITGSLAVLIHADTRLPAATYRYNAFGLREQSSPLSPWQHANKRFNPETGFYHFGRRDYDPELMRFIEPDPLGFSDGINKYAFCHNDPLNFKDHFGLQAERDGWETFTRGAVDFFSSVTSFFASFQNPSYLTPKDIFEYSLGSGFLLLAGYHPTESVSGIFGKGEVSNQVRISYINGILTSYEGALANVQGLSESHGNVNVHYVYRPTKGWIRDMLQGFTVVFGLVSNEAKRLANVWRQMIGEMGQEGKIIHYAHSLGAVETARALSLLTEEEKKRIHIYAFGSPSVGETNPYLQTHYYLSIADGVPLLDLPSYVKAAANNIPNVVFTGAADSVPFIDHFFLNQTYQDIWKSMGRTFVEWYGTL